VLNQKYYKIIGSVNINMPENRWKCKRYRYFDTISCSQRY